MGSHRSEPAPFLTKTYQLLEDPSTDEMISWNESGSTFVVWCPAEFARDVLPKYFKHSNFSSFVRQLNTYGFHKIVPDRWEFANDCFRRGERDLLCEIHRRKSTSASPTAQIPVPSKPNGPPSSTSNSGEDHGSTYTSSPSLPKPETSQISELSDENEKLRKDNLLLSSELAQTKKQCEELAAFLSKYVKVDREKINSIMRGASEGESITEGGEGEEEDCLKLFGVWLKNSKKRARADVGVPGPLKEIKMDYQEPWMRICSPPRGSGKVCN
ncbi:heat shock factor protein HSF24 [Magnolia sinica]|uniref:heat shock factor protein HSF24 n=1 Tax=Magnolia sinica TaxID=86752 RepID=UPI00265968EE|nr:heat shock factor protein HSF24 [Magnolia sinica]